MALDEYIVLMSWAGKLGNRWRGLPPGHPREVCFTAKEVAGARVLK